MYILVTFIDLSLETTIATPWHEMKTLLAALLCNNYFTLFLNDITISDFIMQAMSMLLQE